MKMKVAALTLVLSLLLFAAPAMAKGQPSPLPTPRASGLAQGKLRACQAVEAGVKNRMQSLVNLATNIEKVFDSIATRVEDYYTNKVLPSGKTVSNYGVLTADISTKKGIVDTDLTSAQDTVNSFSCTSSSPRTLLMNFRLDMQKVKGDLKNFRTSIKNLVVAVRTVAPKESSTPASIPTP